MTHQLRRMILVNAGTNKRTPSKRITEIDPRGGAAVMGANGAGKTFTLRLIPLFFGHPLRELVALENGQEGAKFICPSPTSAICFEYERGSDAPEDLRLVVMRAKSDGSDVAEYRIFPCGYNKDLFVKNGQFLNDEASDAVARALGLAPTRKMSTSEYRSVILKTHAAGQDKRLISYALNNSFGPQALPNLDRLVATMLKKGIKFDDLIAVAVGLIEDDLNQDSHVQMRQPRGELERWIRNHDAARRAVALTPSIELLREMLKDFSTTERQWQERRHDVAVLAEDRSKRQSIIDAQILIEDGERAAAARLEREQINERSTEAAQASDGFALAKDAHDAAARDKKHYVDECAEQWERKLSDVVPLRNERESVERDIRAGVSQSAFDVTQNDKEIANIERSTAQSRKEIEAGMAPHRAQYDDACRAIEQAQEREVAELSDDLQSSLEALENQRSPIESEIGALQAAVKNPQPSSHAQTNSDVLTSRLLEFSEDARAHTERSRLAQGRLAQDQKNFDAAESRLREVKRHVEGKTRALADASQRAAPQPGTLMAALQNSPDDAWTRTIARVINPELLGRTDLNAQALADSSDPAEPSGDSLYGWSLDLGALELPQWADGEQRKKAVLHAQEALESSQQTLAEQESCLSQCSAARDQSDKAYELARGEVARALSRQAEAKKALDHAKVALEREKSDAAAKALSALSLANARLVELKAQIGRHKADLGRQVMAVRAGHEARRSEALQRRDAALQSLGALLQGVDSQRERDLRKQQEKFNARLADQGIDPAALSALRSRLDDITAQLRCLADKAPMVQGYRDWLDKGGHEAVAALEGRLKAAARRLQAASEAVEDARASFRVAQSVHDEKIAGLRKQSSELELAANKFTALLEEFAEHPAKAHDQVLLGADADEMKRRVKAQKRDFQKAEDEIRKLFKFCLNDLTLSNSSVRELVETSLEEVGGGEREKARALVRCHGLLGEQVIVTLNNSLDTVLNQITQFHRTIVKFGSQVAKFNGQLQKALGSPKRYERLEDLKLNIVADFSELGFYAKLERMDEITRRQQVESALANRTKLPEAQAVEALRDFMGVLGSDGLLEINLTRHIHLQGSVIENGNFKAFKRAKSLENASSNGLTTLIMITLLVGLVQVVRRGKPVHVPWVTDEVATIDADNFKSLLEMLSENRIDVITASPSLDHNQLSQFKHRYLFQDRGQICRYESSPLGNGETS